MAGFIAQFAASKESSDIFGSLGIDWKLFVFQLIAFGILVFILSKWIFPIFFRIIDKRQAAIEASNTAAIEASKRAKKAQEEIDALLKNARSEAKDIVTTAKDEAAAMVQDAEEKGKMLSEHIVAEAHDDIAKEIVAAKKELAKDTIELVALATEKVVGKAVTDKIDTTVIQTALKESK